MYALRQRPLLPAWTLWARQPGPRCVSSKEGGVRTNTGNGYFGKWQADRDFARAYNLAAYLRLGVPSNWPESEQDRMAWNGWKARGWNPWPTTARLCGLL